MGKCFKNFCPIRAAHMHRKLETGKRCICAFPHRLENGRYLPPIFRAISLHVQKLNKKLTAYAEACEYPYGSSRGEHRIRCGSPLILPVLLTTAGRERLWGTTISQRSPWGGVRSCLRQPRPIFVDKEDRPKPGAYWMCRPCLTSALHEGGALARIIVHTMQGEPGVFFRFPHPPLALRSASYEKSGETTYGGTKGVPEEVIRRWI